MFNEERVYTVEEIKVIFKNAKKEALQKLDNDVERISKQQGQDDPFQRMVMGMGNMLAYAELSRILFNEDTE